MKKTSRQIGMAIIFISILLTYINAVIDTTNKKNQKDDEINYGDIAIRPDKYNSEIEKEFNSVREGNLTDELKFLIQKDTYSKYNEELSTEEEELIKNLVFPDLYKRKKGFSDTMVNKGLYINNTYDNNNKYLQSLLLLNLDESAYEPIITYSSDEVIYNSKVNLTTVNEVKNALLGPDVSFEPSSFNFMDNNQNLIFDYDSLNGCYFVGERDFEFRNNSIYGIYEEIYDVEENGEFINIYSSLISYNAIYDFDLNSDEYSKKIKFQLYSGIFENYYDEINTNFENQVNYLINKKSKKFMYTFKKASDGNYYFYSSMNVK